MVGYPSSVSEGLPEALSAHGVDTTEFSLMYAYRPEEVGNEWQIYDPNAAPYVNSLTEMGPGWGYWIYVTADSTWEISYSAP
jgi:hypothetical protein